MFARRDGTVVVAMTGDGASIFAADGKSRPLPNGLHWSARLVRPKTERFGPADDDGSVWRYAGRSLRGHQSRSQRADRVDAPVARRALGREPRHRRGASRPSRRDRRLRVKRANGLLGDTLWGLFEDREATSGSPRMAAPRACATTTRRSRPNRPVARRRTARAPRSERLRRPPNRRRHLDRHRRRPRRPLERRHAQRADRAGRTEQQFGVCARGDAEGRFWIGDVGGVNCLSVTAGSVSVMKPPAMIRILYGRRDNERRPVTGVAAAIPPASPAPPSTKPSPSTARRTELTATNRIVYAVRPSRNASASPAGGGRRYRRRRFLFRTCPDCRRPAAPALRSMARLRLVQHPRQWTLSLIRSDRRRLSANSLGGSRGREVMVRTFMPYWTTATGARRPMPPARCSGIAAACGSAPANGLESCDTNPLRVEPRLPPPCPRRKHRRRPDAAPNGNRSGSAKTPGSSRSIRGDFHIRTRVSKADGLIDDEAWAYDPLAVGATAGSTSRRRAASRFSIRRCANRNADRRSFAFATSTFREDRSGNNEISIAYAALTFSDESRVVYRTRLYGYDNDWSAGKGRHQDPLHQPAGVPLLRSTYTSR